jgi:phosphoribosylpyrophosphate synthetase
MALHAPQVHGFFSVPVDHLTAIGVLADHYRAMNLDNHIVVSPDLGNAKTATLFAGCSTCRSRPEASSAWPTTGRHRRDRR